MVVSCLTCQPQEGFPGPPCGEAKVCSSVLLFGVWVHNFRFMVPETNLSELFVFVIYDSKFCLPQRPAWEAVPGNTLGSVSPVPGRRPEAGAQVLFAEAFLGPHLLSCAASLGSRGPEPASGGICSSLRNATVLWRRGECLTWQRSTGSPVTATTCSFLKGVSRGDAPGWGAAFSISQWYMASLVQKQLFPSLTPWTCCQPLWEGGGAGAAPGETDVSASVGGRRNSDHRAFALSTTYICWVPYPRCTVHPQGNFWRRCLC